MLVMLTPCVWPFSSFSVSRLWRSLTLKATADLGSRAGSGERLTVTGVKEGRWLFKDTITMEPVKPVVAVDAGDAHALRLAFFVFQRQQVVALADADLGSRAGSGERLTVTGVKEGRWLFKDTITMENAPCGAWRQKTRRRRSPRRAARCGRA
jgi:hypothetical protein